MKQQTQNCQNCKKDFIIEPDDFLFYEKLSISAKYKIPAPTWCSECRFQRRCIFRNERKLFRNINPITDKPILGLFPVEAKFPVYEDSYWFSDNWDPFSYGVDFDKSKSFFF